MREPRIHDPIRVGIIGLGYWGPKLARNFHELDGACKVAMAADLRQERFSDLKELCPDAAVTNDYRDLLNSAVDAVVIATPVGTHYRLAKEALLAGKHVLVEKPMAENAIQGEQLVAIARQNNLRLMVGHTFLYNPAVETVRRVILAGELGEIYYLNAARVNLGLLQPDINVMWDLAPHDFSMFNFILDEDPVKVSAIGGVYVNKSGGLPEVVYVTLRYRNDVIANLRVSWLDPVKIRQLTVVGSKKMLVYDDISENKVMLYDKGVDVTPNCVTEVEFHAPYGNWPGPDRRRKRRRTEAEFRASYRNGPESKIPVEWSEPLQAECQHFINSIRNGSAPFSDGEHGLKIIKILESAQRSLVNGGLELTIEY
jgi:predicted dehydrogenase